MKNFYFYLAGLALLASAAELVSTNSGDTPTSREWVVSQKKQPDKKSKQRVPFVRALRKSSTPALLAPSITATNNFLVTSDVGLAGASAGDELEYTVKIENVGPDPANGTTFTETIDINTTLVAGSLKVSPIAVNDSYSTIGNVGINIAAAQGLFVNDISPTGASLSLNSPTIVTSAKNGTATITAGTGAFTYEPTAGYVGADSFTYKIENGSGMTSTATVTITVVSAIWFIDDDAAAGGTGTLAKPFKTLGAFQAINDGGNDRPQDGHSIFIYSGNYDGGITVRNLQKVFGQGATSSLLSLTSLPAPSGSNLLPGTGGTRPALTNTSGNVFSLTGIATVQGLNIGNSSGAKFFSSTSGTFMASEIDLTGTGVALNISDKQLNASFGQVSSEVTGGTSPIKLSNVSGDLAITSGILRATNTPALDIVGPIALAVNLTAVHANGGSKGMIISNTSGTFQVTGTGTTAGSGGTIQNITQRGIELLSATNVTLKNMNLTNANTTDGTEPANEDNSAANAALHAFNVNGLTMDGIVISGTVSQEGVNLRNSSNFNFKNGVIGPSGQGSQEGCIYATNTGGTNTITNSTFTGPGGRVVYFSNRDTDMTLLTVDNSTFQDSKNSGLQFFGYGTSNMKLKVQNNSKFLRNPTVGVYVGANNTAVMQADIKNSSVDVGNGFGRVFDLAAAGSSTLKFNITNNTGNFNGGIGLNMFAYENGYLEGNVVGNTLTNKPASSGVSAIAIDTQGATGRGTFRIENNTILNCIDSPGIAALTTSSTGQQTNIHLIGNSVQVFGTLDNIFNGINLATTSATGNNSKLCIEVLRNAVSVPAPRLALRTRSNYATTQVLIQGPGPGVVDAWNAGSNTPTGSVLQSGQAFPYLFNQTCAPTNVSALREGIVEESSSERTIVLEAPAQEPFQAAEIAATSAEPVIEEAPETVTAAPGSARTEAVLAGETVTVNGTGAGFTIPAGRSTTIKFKATINTTIPTAVCQVTTQGTVSGSNFSSVPTDGPGGSSTNSTVTTVTSVPIITFCPGNITVNLDAGTCTATRTFAATADACPAATITYKVAGNPITFPYIFPAGATTVTVTASNGIGTAPTCTFTVTVTPIPAPVVTRNPVVQNICAGGSASFTVAGTGTINTYQWQKKPFGGSFANISSASNATAATATLSLTNLPVTDDKSQYQCIASNPCASSTSQAATLNVKQITASSIAGTVSVNQASPNPTITFGGTGGTLPYTFSYKINNGTTQTLSTTGVATTASLTQSTGIVGLFSYELVLVTDALGCTLTPATAQKADVTVVNNLTASISAGTSVCVGATSAQVTFTAVNGIAPFTFSYKLNGGPTIPLDAAGLTSTATVTVPTTASGTFSYALVSVSGAGGGGSQPAGQTASVVVNEVPTIVLSGAQYECNSALDGYTVFFKATTGSTVTSDKGTVTGNTVSGIPSGQSAILTVTKNGCSSTLPVSRNCALPVTLVNFSVSKQENVVILNWKTTAETNSEKFDIERSADAKNWQTIGVKSSGGESSSDLYYSFTDNEPTLGDNFYRLKMVDKDQTFSYSKIAFVSMNGNAKLQVYPNPVSDVLFLKTNEWAKIKSIELYNLRGTMVYKSGNNIAKTINVRDLPVGIYIISVFRKDGKITNQKVLIER